MNEPKSMRVRSADGCLVRDPATRQALPPEGLVVPRSSYWSARLEAGDVVEVLETAPVREPEPVRDATDKPETTVKPANRSNRGKEPRP